MAQPDLTTPEKVKSYLNVGEEFSPEMEQSINDLIFIASGLVREYTGRRFTSPPSPETRIYHLHGRDHVYVEELLKPSDLAAVTDGAGMALPFELEWENPIPKGVTIHLRSDWDAGGRDVRRGGLSGTHVPEDHLDLFVRNTWGGVGGRNLPNRIGVTGTFGYPEGKIPPSVEFATRRAVALWIQEEIAHYTDDAFISRGRQFEPEELPPLTIAMLRKSWKVREAVAI